MGCRVAGFKRSGDGAVGQAERLGQVGEGDILTEVNDIPVSGMLFDKVIVCGDECHNMVSTRSMCSLTGLGSGAIIIDVIRTNYSNDSCRTV